MTHPNGKHQTNCAGEWREGDRVCKKDEKGRPSGSVMFYIIDNTDGDSMHSIIVGGCVLQDCAVDVDDFQKMKSQYINISELARAAGREL